MSNLSTHIDNQRRTRNQRIADLRHQKEEAERQLARLQREAAQQPLDDSGPAYTHADSRHGSGATRRERHTAVMPSHYVEPEPADDGLFSYDAAAGADAGYGDAAYGDEPFEDEPFADEPFGAEAFSHESYGTESSRQ